jgi:hypothetical protein
MPNKWTILICETQKKPKKALSPFCFRYFLNRVSLFMLKIITQLPWKAKQQLPKEVGSGGI